MFIEHSTTNHITLILVRGRLDQTGTPELELVLTRLLNQNNHYLMLDFTEVPYVNSAGLRCLVSAWRRAKKKGGDLILFNLNARLTELFQMVGFDHVFPIYPSADLAHKHWQNLVKS